MQTATHWVSPLNWGTHVSLPWGIMAADVELWELLNRLKEWQLTRPLTIVGVFRREDPENLDFTRGELELGDRDLDDLESGIRSWLRSPRSMNESYMSGWESAAHFYRGVEKSGDPCDVQEVVEWIVEDHQEQIFKDKWRGELDLVHDGARDWFLAYTGRIK